jgi:hypothetical protein
MAGKHSRTIVKGCHRKPAAPKRVASRAGSAVFATAAAGAIAVTAVSGGHHTSLPSVSLTADVSITSPQAEQVVHTVIVRPGDSLSSIAARDCGTAADWTGLYEKNKGAIGGDPNRVEKGTRLALDCEARPVQAVAYYHPDTSGGTLSFAGLEDLWESAGGPSWAAWDAAEIAECESGGREYAENPSGASGYWQILGEVVAGDIFDPEVNARNAVAKFEDSHDTFAQWVCRA